jgi:hypothetical protein
MILKEAHVFLLLSFNDYKPSSHSATTAGMSTFLASLFILPYLCVADIKGDFFGSFLFMYDIYDIFFSTLLHLPHLRFHCVEGCWDRTQDSCDYDIDYQTL